MSEIYMKSQPSFDKYKPAAKRFLARLYFIVRGLNQDQIKVIFRTTIPNWYSSAKKADKIRASESWESTYTWVKKQLINKIMEYLKLWYTSEAGAKYREQWQFTKFVFIRSFYL